VIKIDRTDTCGWEAAVRGMRNPLNSWDKTDSHYCWEPTSPTGGCFGCELRDDRYCRVDKYVLGKADLDLMKRLVGSGTDHSKFMRMITVTVDLTAPLYWWKEFDTYKVGTVANSCSTMHKIQAKQFTLDDFSHEHLQDELDFERTFKTYLLTVIDGLNEAREMYLETKDKFYWWQMIQLLPSSYNQKRTVQLNYAVLKNVYHARKSHKLDEWHTFCDWVEHLPYSELITM
jgi:hypothetical protein